MPVSVGRTLGVFAAATLLVILLVDPSVHRARAQGVDAPKKEREWAAVADFTKDASVQDGGLTGTAIAAKLEQTLSGRYRLVTRSHLAKSLQELKFNVSDLADQKNAQAFGKMVGARYLVTGSIVQIGRKITIAAQIFSVETGEIKQTAEITGESADELGERIPEIAKVLPMNDEEKEKYLASLPPKPDVAQPPAVPPVSGQHTKEMSDPSRACFLSIPENWQVQQQPGNQTAGMAPDDSAEAWCQSLPKQVQSADQLANLVLGNAGSSVPGFFCEGKQALTIGGAPAVMASASASPANQNGRKIRYIYVFIVTNTHQVAIWLCCADQRYDAGMKNLFSGILNSVRLQ